ncbi:MAG: type II toxin-antitoxin system RelE/ParE family toxin [Leptospiraceae bacterium]|nr:type II toxin-antitoxin system RelE/ParE family toxin [Leptospiraceae bacterium]MCP5497746.1 type II toxin-antitoxin system RelE/ParE family toxin [Leptospiraceae bacterium]
MVEILIYETKNGRKPFEEWLDSIKDIKTKTSVKKGIEKLKNIDYRNFKPIVGIENLFELKFSIAGGIRIYFGKVDKAIIILLCAGNKSSQRSDIAKAKEYWIECLED